MLYVKSTQLKTPYKDGTTPVAALAHLGNCSLRCPTSRHPWRSPALRGIRASMHIIVEPLDFIARLAALVPKPRVNLTRFHGVFAPNSKHRVQVTPAKRCNGNKTKAPDEPQDQTPAERRAAMTWPFSHIPVLHGT